MIKIVSKESVNESDITNRLLAVFCLFKFFHPEG